MVDMEGFPFPVFYKGISTAFKPSLNSCLLLEHMYKTCTELLRCDCYSKSLLKFFYTKPMSL